MIDAPPDRRRPAVLGEIALLVLGFAAFTFLHGAMTTDIATPTANALSLRSLEKTLHLDVELAMNGWLTEHPALILPSVLYYRGYYVVLLGILVWTYLRHTGVYLRARRTLLVMLALVLPIYWAVPMSPPRFALPGVVDVVAEHSPIGAHAPQATDGQVLYSAMPSMHTAWSLWCAYFAWSALRASAGSTRRPRPAPTPAGPPAIRPGAPAIR